jgi:PTS system cellobiose-specific IIA component
MRIIDEEKTVMDLIVHAGSARSLAMEAVTKAKAGSFEDAAKKLAESEEEICQAHACQVRILEQSLDESGTGISMLMVHALDQMMNAVTLLDMTREIVDLYRLLHDTR